MSNPREKIVTNIVAHRIRKKPPVLISDTAWLVDLREETFAVLVADGIPLAIAYKTAGFAAKYKANAALHLYKAPRIQARVTAILQARASSPAVTLPEVTDMLKRVYVGAIHSGEYNPAHNAAFSLARLYGLVVDRAQLDVIRRPSREPDAPAEQELSSWIAALPALSQGPVVSSVDTTQVVRPEPYNQGPIIDATAFGSDLDGPGGTENGAPTGRVTGTPYGRAHSGHEVEAAGPRADHDPAMQPLAASRDAATGFSGGGEAAGGAAQLSFAFETGSPFADEGTGIQGVEPPISAEDLF